MKIDQILKADILDIIFDNRNKHYGAYTLRKFYQERLYKALAITFVFIALLSLFFSLQHGDKTLVKPEIETVLGSLLPDADPVKERIEPPVAPEKPKQPADAVPIKSQLHTSTIQIVSDPSLATRLAANLDSVAISNVTNDPVGTGGKQIVNAIPGTGTRPTVGSSTETPKTIDKTKPVFNAEVMPAYPGGEAALIKFLQKNLQNPESLEEGEMVSVKIRFIVGYDGILKGFETVQDGGAAFNNEVIRVLKKMPSWIPGKTAGENVSVYYTIPVKFVPQD